MPASLDARSPFALLDEVQRAREVLVLKTLEYFERLALSDARALGALVTVVSDATMVHPDPVVVRRAGTQYLDGRALCPRGAFHPKLLVIVGDDQARVAIGSGNLTMAGWHANAELWTVLRAGSGRRTQHASPGLGVLARPRKLRRHAQRRRGGCAASDRRSARRAARRSARSDAAAFASRSDRRAAPRRRSRRRAGPLRAVSRRRARRCPRAARSLRPVDVDGLRAAGDRGRWQRADRAGTTAARPRRMVSRQLPRDGDAPPGGVESLIRTATDQADRPGLVLLSATCHADVVTVHLHQPLAFGGVLQRYDIADDLWRTSATLAPGSQTYQVALASAPIGQAVRVVRDDHATSNGVFVADPERLRRRQEKAIGKVRATPAEIARLGLGDHLLADLDELRSHLLRAGVAVIQSGPHADGDEDDDHPPAAARPADGLSLDDFLAACDPVLGQRMTEFSLLLPALPGVGAGLDDTLGTLDADEDIDMAEPGGDADEPTLGEELRRQTASQRDRYRRFLERLVDRTSQYPVVVRNLAAHSTLHALAAGIWDEDEWPPVLAEVTCALGAGGDEPNRHEREAAGSLAAVALALLRTDVIRLSRRDEQMMRYESTGRAVTDLLPHRPQQTSAVTRRKGIRRRSCMRERARTRGG